MIKEKRDCVKKVILRYTFIVACLFGIAIGIIVIQDFKQEALLEKEVTDMDILMNQNYINDILIERKINTYVTTGDYLEVEKAVKTFYQDVYECFKEINEILYDQNIVNLLTIYNFKKDGPAFDTSLKFIEEKKGRLVDLEEEATQLFTEEHIMNYIKEKKLDSYYEKYYHDLLFGEDDYQTDESIKESIKKLIDVLDKIKNVLNFLKENEKGWKIEHDQINFATEELEQEYIRLLNIIALDDEGIAI